MLRAYIRVRTDEQLQAVQSVIKNLPNGSPEVFLLCPVNTDESQLSDIRSEGVHVYADLPFITRENKCGIILDDINKAASWSEGLVIKNMDEIGMIKSIGYKGGLIADSFLYAYNSKAMAFYRELFPEISFMAPDELTDEELKRLPGSRDIIYKAYGRARVMLTAQSISDNYKTQDAANITSARHDRFISADEEYGYSVIYTDRPVSMPEAFTEGTWENVMADLTLEDRSETVRVIKAMFEGGTAPSGENGHHYKGID